MTKDTLEKANNLVMEKYETEQRLKTLKELAKLRESIEVEAVRRVERYNLMLTEEDIDVLIDHEEMKLGEYERKFKEL